MPKKGCISPEHVTCPKTSDYLKSKGLLCNTKPEKPKKPVRKGKGWFERWFG